MKRAFDILFSLVLLLVTSPLMILIVIAQIIFAPGNPFFLHERVGKHEKRFNLIKFRTMRHATGTSLGLTIANDARITGIGRVLRRLKLDELPQFFNVLKGEMSLVGPRPETPEFVKYYNESQLALLNYRPGLTDPATLKYRHEEKLLARFEAPVGAYIREILPDKTAISLDYMEKRTFVSDLGIMIVTALSIFKSAPGGDQEENS
jgi:lipopolysaccharide/colanic/teichoic acid biosynthesis glycosyltransferase